jgi:hypothetical protein
MSRTFRLITGVGLGLLMTVATVAAQAKAKKIKYEELPPAVQITVDAQTSGLKVWGYTTEAVGGKTIYRVDLFTHHRPRIVTIAADGKLVSVDDRIPWQSIPADVQTALLAGARPGTLGEFHSISMNGKIVYYTAIVDIQGERHRISVKLEGAVLEAVASAPETTDEK